MLQASLTLTMVIISNQTYNPRAQQETLTSPCSIKQRPASHAAPAAVAGLGMDGDCLLVGSGIPTDLDCAAVLGGCDCVEGAVSECTSVPPANSTRSMVLAPMAVWQNCKNTHIPSSSYNNSVLTTCLPTLEKVVLHGAHHSTQPTQL